MKSKQAGQQLLTKTSSIHHSLRTDYCWSVWYWPRTSCAIFFTDTQCRSPLA